MNEKIEIKEGYVDVAEANSNKEKEEGENAADYLYISRRHYDRKMKVEDDKMASIASNLTKPGPIGAIVITLFDGVVEFIARFLVYFFEFGTAGFDYVMAYTFGNFDGLFPNVAKNGTVFRYRFFRYVINLVLPPLGVFLSKGLYGWFNIFICCVLTYVHYVLGIVYCFIITANNRYADLYEEMEFKKIAENNENYKNKGKGDIWALITVGVLFSLMIFILVMMFSFI